MHIVVLDGATLNPGDLSWDALRALGSCEIYDRTPDEQAAERAAGAEIAITNKTMLSRSALESLPQLRFIAVTATGYNCVDVAAARERGIPVANVPTYGTSSVAEMVFAHLLNLTFHVSEHAQSVQSGDWSRQSDFCYWNFPLVELSGQTLGVVGFGRIGRAVARAALGFGMRVLAYDANPIQPVEGVQAAALDALCAESDVVSLHCPLTASNERLVNRERLALMKPTAFLINTSRGGLVDEQALAEALNAGRLAGAGLDVLTVEPPPPGNPLLSVRNCYVTPHIAWATKAARARLLRAVVENVQAFLAGRPQNVVNG